MSEAVVYRGVAKVFWNGGSQAVRLPKACRFDANEVEVLKRGREVILRPRGKDWDAFFDLPKSGSWPDRDQPPWDDRDIIL